MQNRCVNDLQSRNKWFADFHFENSEGVLLIDIQNLQKVALIGSGRWLRHSAVCGCAVGTRSLDGRINVSTWCDDICACFIVCLQFTMTISS